ncbi:hypothetical protein DFP73DRAFT_385977 [Morchella snyderi]|nr:hypothetical protein DFP73DRAFT_385977 [Morchella snyderi]
MLIGHVIWKKPCKLLSLSPTQHRNVLRPGTTYLQAAHATMSKNNEELSDDFVASLLSKEASEKNIKYSTLGLQAFLPKRSATNAPKPNTRFLRNIVREADNHNAALLAKEAEESKERLRQLHLKERAKRRGEVDGVPVEKSRAAQRPDRQIYTVGAKRKLLSTRGGARNGLDRDKDSDRKRRRSRSKEGKEDGRTKRHRSRSMDRRSRSPSLEKEKGRRRHGSRSRERRRSGERRRDRSREHRSDGRRESHKHHSSRHYDSKDKGNSRHSHRSRSPSRSRERDGAKSKSALSSHRSDKNGLSSETTSKPYSSRPRSPRRRPEESDADHERRRKRRKEMELVEEPSRSSRASTDPLNDIIGPEPAHVTRIRGRGTLSGASAMDARFSENYDPSLDVQPDVADGEDWDDALEAYRDRQKWKALGAERLRTEGFGEDFIKAWENNDTKNTANIKWLKEGVREWDRGKVIEAGEVKVKAIWAKD